MTTEPYDAESRDPDFGVKRPTCDYCFKKNLTDFVVATIGGEERYFCSRECKRDFTSDYEHMEYGRG